MEHKRDTLAEIERMKHSIHRKNFISKYNCDIIQRHNITILTN